MFSECITVYHTDNAGMNYVKNVYRGVSIYRQNGQAGEKGGNAKDDEYIIRIITPDKLPLYVDDFVFIGETEDERPDFGKCLKIYQINDNRRGIKIMRHYKIRCR